MALFSQYGTAQRIGFVIVCVGFSLCLVGSIAPYWITAETIDLRVGLWYYCIDWRVEDKCYELYHTSDHIGPDEDRYGWINTARGCDVITVMLGLLSGLTACCRSLCCSGGRTICHGVLSFFAGAFGLITFAIFHWKTKSLFDSPMIDIDNGWALGIFVLGSILFVIASFILCCAMPREMNYGMVMTGAPAAPGISVNVSNTNSNVNQYNAGGHIGSFEPLPNVAGPSPQYHPSAQPVGHGYPPPPPPAYGYNQPGEAGYNYPK